MKVIIFVLGIAIGIGAGYATWHVDVTAGTCVDAVGNKISTGIDDIINKFTTSK